MKSKTLNYMVYGFICFTLMGCEFSVKNNTQTKAEYSVRTDSKAKYVFSKGDKKVEMILELEKDAGGLVIGQPITAYFKTKNIDTKKFTISGPGIMVKQGTTDEFKYTIVPTERFLVNEKLEILVTEKIENEADFSHKFLVPVSTP